MKKLLLSTLILLSACTSSSALDGSYHCAEDNFIVIIDGDTFELDDGELNFQFKYEEVSENTYHVLIDESAQIDDAYFEYDSQLDQINLLGSHNDRLECPRQK